MTMKTKAAARPLFACAFRIDMDLPSLPRWPPDAAPTATPPRTSARQDRSAGIRRTWRPATRDRWPGHPQRLQPQPPHAAHPARRMASTTITITAVTAYCIIWPIDSHAPAFISLTEGLS